jgi:hypothetical protein
MKQLVIAMAMLVIAGLATAEDNAIGLYFSGSEFTIATASANFDDFARIGYVVLTEATGDVVTGYELGISCSEPGFVFWSTLIWGENDGTDLNHLVTFFEPRVVSPGGTVLSDAIVSYGGGVSAEVMFGPADPSTLPDTPVVFFDGVATACSYPFGSPVVAWLNSDPVASEGHSWSRVKWLFR